VLGRVIKRLSGVQGDRLIHVAEVPARHDLHDAVEHVGSPGSGQSTVSNLNTGYCAATFSNSEIGASLLIALL
jgi:hypothetical protein